MLGRDSPLPTLTEYPVELIILSEPSAMTEKFSCPSTPLHTVPRVPESTISTSAAHLTGQSCIRVPQDRPGCTDPQRNAPTVPGLRQ